MIELCKNILESSIPLDKFINDAGDFDFELIKPMPSIVRDLVFMAPSKEEIEEIRKKGDIVLYNKYHLCDIAEEKTGSRSQKEWCLKNWGTEKNAITTRISDDMCTIHFTTRWNPPTEIIEELARIYPEEKFILKFVEPMLYFSGRMIYEGNGKIPDYKEYRISEPEGEEISDEILGKNYFEENWG